MQRFEDQGITLRLFISEHDAKNTFGVLSVAKYGPGVIAKNARGQWLDAHGVLPGSWAPKDSLLKTPVIHGYYVDQDGVVRCADVAPRGYSFLFQDKTGYKLVAIVDDCDGEVLDEFVLWPSLQALADSGERIDIAE